MYVNANTRDMNTDGIEYDCKRTKSQQRVAGENGMSRNSYGMTYELWCAWKRDNIQSSTHMCNKYDDRKYSQTISNTWIYTIMKHNIVMIMMVMVMHLRDYALKQFA